MRLSKRLNNIYQDIAQAFRRYNYIIVPVLVTMVYMSIYNFKGFSITLNLKQNICNISGVLIGFLFTAHSIILVLPGDKKFINLLKEYGYLKIMFINIFLGEITLMISLVLSLLDLFGVINLLFFLIGLTYTIILSVTLFLISFYIVS